MDHYVTHSRQPQEVAQLITIKLEANHFAGNVNQDTNVMAKRQPHAVRGITQLECLIVCSVE